MTYTSPHTENTLLQYNICAITAGDIPDVNSESDNTAEFDFHSTKTSSGDDFKAFDKVTKSAIYRAGNMRSEEIIKHNIIYSDICSEPPIILLSRFNI